MSKPFKAKDILQYLIKNYSAGTTLYSQRDIARSLAVSQFSVQRVSSSFRAYMAEYGHKIEDFDGKDNSEVIRMLALSVKADTMPCNRDFELLLDFLGQPGGNLKNTLNALQNELNETIEEAWDEFHSGKSNTKASDIASNLSAEGINFFRSCNYSTFSFNLHNYCQKMEYSDRVKFKPAEYLEIGVIPYAKARKENEKNINSVSYFIFYAYLPFSRETTMMLIEPKKSRFTSLMISCLSFFLTTTAKGLPLKIIGEDRIGVVFNGADTKLVEKYLLFCNRLYSSDKSHCTFKDTEAELIKKVQDALKPLTKDNQKLHRNEMSRQKRIDEKCNEHNNQEHIKKAFEKECKVLNDNPLPDDRFILDLESKTLQNNCHIQYNGKWFSSYYKCAFPLLALEFSRNEIFLITKDFIPGLGEIIRSRHHLYPPTKEEEKKEKRYYTNADDLPENDEEAKAYGLLTANSLLQSIIEIYKDPDESEYEAETTEPAIILAKQYLDSKPYPQQAFVTLSTMLRKNPQEIRIIKKECINILNRPDDTSWKKLFTDLIINNVTSTVESDSIRTKALSPCKVTHPTISHVYKNEDDSDDNIPPF